MLRQTAILADYAQKQEEFDRLKAKTHSAKRRKTDNAKKNENETPPQTDSVEELAKIQLETEDTRTRKEPRVPRDGSKKDGSKKDGK